MVSFFVRTSAIVCVPSGGDLPTLKSHVLVSLTLILEMEGAQPDHFLFSLRRTCVRMHDALFHNDEQPNLEHRR